MKKLSLLIWVSLVLPGSVFAVGSGGYNNDIADARSLGNGMAVVARIDSPACNWYNPACLTQTEGAQISLSGMYENVTGDFDSVFGLNIETEEGNYFIPSLFYSQNINEKLAYGIGVSSPYGLKTEWDNPITDYVATMTELKVILFNPNIAYTVNDQISIAFGLDVARADGTMKKKINETVLNSALYALSTGILALLPSPDAESSLDGSDTGYGWNVALLYKINDKAKAGFSYRSPIEFSLDGKVAFSGLNGLTALVFGSASYSVDASLDLPLPATVTAGISYQISEKTSVEMDIELAQWSKLDQFKIDYNGETDLTRLLVLNLDNPVAKDWEDTWNTAIGIEHKIDETYAVAAGMRYRPTPVPEETFEISIPSSDLFDIHGGVFISFESSKLDFSFSYVMGKARDIDNSVGYTSGTSINGEHHLKALVLGMTYTYKF